MAGFWLTEGHLRGSFPDLYNVLLEPPQWSAVAKVYVSKIMGIPNIARKDGPHWQQIRLLQRKRQRQRGAWRIALFNPKVVSTSSWGTLPIYPSCLEHSRHVLGFSMSKLESTLLLERGKPHLTNHSSDGYAWLLWFCKMLWLLSGSNKELAPSQSRSYCVFISS